MVNKLNSHIETQKTSEKNTSIDGKINSITSFLKEQLSNSFDPENTIISKEKAQNWIQEIENTSPEKVLKIEREIDKLKNSTSDYVNLLQEVRSKQELYSKSEAQSIIDESVNFITLNNLERKKRVNSLEKDIKDRNKQIKNFKNVSQNKQDYKNFKELNYKERQEKIKLAQNLQNQLDEISKKINSESDITKTFYTLDLYSKERFIMELKDSLKDKINKTFNDLPDKYKKLCPNFITMNKLDKINFIEKIRSEIRKDYLKKLYSNKFLTDSDVSIMEGTVEGDFDINFAEICISFFDQSVKLAEECHKISTNYSNETLNHFNWSKISSFERKQIISDKKLETYAKEKDHIKADKAFEKFINSKIHKGINMNIDVSITQKFSKENSQDKIRFLINNGEKIESNKNLNVLSETNLNKEYNLHLKLQKIVIEKFLIIEKNLSYEEIKKFLKADLNQRIKIIERNIKKEKDLSNKILNTLQKPKNSNFFSGKEIEAIEANFAKMSTIEKENYLPKINESISQKINIEKFIQKNMNTFKKDDNFLKLYVKYKNQDLTEIKESLEDYINQNYPKLKKGLNQILNKNLNRELNFNQIDKKIKNLLSTNNVTECKKLIDSLDNISAFLSNDQKKELNKYKEILLEKESETSDSQIKYFASHFNNHLEEKSKYPSNITNYIYLKKIKNSQLDEDNLDLENIIIINLDSLNKENYLKEKYDEIIDSSPENLPNIKFFHPHIEDFVEPNVAINYFQKHFINKKLEDELEEFLKQQKINISKTNKQKIIAKI